MPPTLHVSYQQEQAAGRRVTWLEFLHDLVFAAALVGVGGILRYEASFVLFLGVAALLIPLWWSWHLAAAYTNRFAIDTIWYWALIPLQIFVVAALASTAPDALGTRANEFALAFVATRLVLAGLYGLVWQRSEGMRPYLNHMLIGFAIVVFIWLLSIFIPSPYHYIFWGVATLIDLGIPFAATMRGVPDTTSLDVPHMMERYSIATILVIGVAVLLVLFRASVEPVGVGPMLYGLFGLIILGSLGWLYLAHSSTSQLNSDAIAPTIWLYAHLPLVFSVTALTAGMQRPMFLAPDVVGGGYRWVVAGAILVFALAMMLLDMVTVRSAPPLSDNRLRLSLHGGMALVVVLLALIGGWLVPAIFLILLAVLCVLAVIVEQKPDMLMSGLSRPAAGEPATSGEEPAPEPAPTPAEDYAGAAGGEPAPAPATTEGEPAPATTEGEPAPATTEGEPAPPSEDKDQHHQGGADTEKLS
jgi:low temperature requirement protein LtrA